MISDRVKANLKREFSRSLLAKLGVVLLTAMILMAVFAPVLATHDPTRTGYFDEETSQPYPPMGTQYDTTVAGDDNETTDGNATEREDFSIDVSQEATVGPTSEHALGTNQVGQDVFSRFIYGARVSILVGLAGTLLAVLIGVPVGLVAGYYGGRIDDLLMRIADMMLAFPALIFALTLMGAFGNLTVDVPDPIVALGLVGNRPETVGLPGDVTLVVGLVFWVWFARVARGETLSVRNQEYVKAAKSFGASDLTILRRHVLPNVLTPVIVLATIQVAAAILLEASLSYLGFSGTTLSWGWEIQQGQQKLTTWWWISLFPGIGIVLTVIGVNLLGDWLRDSLDPNIEGEGGGGGA